MNEINEDAVLLEVILRCPLLVEESGACHSRLLDAFIQSHLDHSKNVEHLKIEGHAQGPNVT